MELKASSARAATTKGSSMCATTTASTSASASACTICRSCANRLCGQPTAAVAGQPAQRQHLRGQEIGPSQQRQMDPNESRPGCRALALGRGRQSVALQDIANRLIADLVPQIGQRPRNPVITPVTVLLGNLSFDPRPAGLRRAFEPSNLRATSLRYQARMVSGRATLATSPRNIA